MKLTTHVHPMPRSNKIVELYPTPAYAFMADMGEDVKHYVF
jgi:hypothetical protein